MPILLVLILLLAPAIAAAQSPTASNGTSGRDELPALPELPATKFSGAIRVDGRLDEAAWETAQVGRDFRQLDPNEGEPATEPTEVRVLYDDQALYIGMRMFDSEPNRIRGRLGRRDEGLTGSDLVEVYIDSYHDRVSGYLFRITPAGAVRDATITATGGNDASWDGVWEGAAQIDSLGWTAEFRIPFSQLRYNPRSGPQTFGIDFRRVVARKSETTMFAFTPRRTQWGPARFATLTGLSDLPRSRYLEIMPYVTGRAERLNIASDNPFRGSAAYQAKAGFDVRYGLTSGLTLSGTVNPDFGQVEVDPARVNLTANELFFPERRPFFVEGADVFRYGRIRSFNNYGFPTLFHSRRIGRPPQYRVDFDHPFADMPEEATIAAAAKIAGQLRPGTSVGILNAYTLRELAEYETDEGLRGEAAVEPRTNYFVGRARQDFRNGNTQVGLFTTAVNRDLGDGFLAELLRRDAYFAGIDFRQSWRNQTYSLDGSIGRSLVLGSEAAIARTQRSAVHYFQRPDLREKHYDPSRTSLYGTSWQLSGGKMAGERAIASITWQGVTPGFETNDMGFHSNSAFQGVSTVFGLKSDKPSKYLRNYLVGPFTGTRWNFDGDRTDEYYGFHLDGRFRNFWGFNVNLAHGRPSIDDRLTRGGPAAMRPARNSLEFGLWTDSRRVWFYEQYYEFSRTETGGWEHDLWTSFTVRPTTALRVSVSPALYFADFDAQYLRAVDDAGATGTYDRRYVFGELLYKQLSVETRVDWTFTPRLSLQVFAQPLIADGEYRAFKSLRTSRTFDFDYFREEDGTLTREDGAWIATAPGGSPINLGNPDFNSRSLVGNAVLRWEYRPGSALFFVWQQRRNGFQERPGFAVARDLGGIFSDNPENVFAIKASYWFGR